MRPKVDRGRLYDELRSTLTADNIFDWCDVASALVAIICVHAGIPKEEYLKSCAAHYDVLDKGFSTTKPN